MKNSIYLTGQIKSMFFSRKKELKCKLSLKNKNGTENFITVRFFEPTASYVVSRFRKNDFVRIEAYAQSVRNIYTSKSSLEIWGLSIYPFMKKSDTELSTHKYTNNVYIEGNVSTVSVNGNFSYLTIYTKNKLGYNKKDFTSYVPIRVNVPSDFKIEKGDTVKIRGFIVEKLNADKKEYNRYIIPITKTIIKANENVSLVNDKIINNNKKIEGKKNEE